MMAQIRLEVLVNGSPLCTAGIDEDGHLDATVRHRFLGRPSRMPFGALFAGDAIEENALFVH
jgi:hypothetical protein